MKTTVNIHLLSSDKDSNLVIVEEDEKSHAKDVIWRGQNQHIYFTLPQSDLEISKIKEGDYCINIINKTIRQSDHNVDYEQNHWEKIIACTEDLYISEHFWNGMDAGIKRLPYIPQSFISYYGAQYNKGNVIKTAEIELEDCGTKDKDSLGIIEHTDTDGFGFYMGCRLKLNSSNEVIVVPTIDKMYSRDEVVNLFHQYRLHAWKNGITIQDLTKWIKENLV